MDSHRFILVKNCVKYLGTEAMQVESLIRVKPYRKLQLDEPVQR